MFIRYLSVLAVVLSIISCSHISEDEFSVDKTILTEEKHETTEMKDFKRAILERRSLNAGGQKNENTSIFNTEGEEYVIEAAQNLLLSFDVSDEVIQSLNDRQVIQMALKYYAQEAQSEIKK